MEKIILLLLSAAILLANESALSKCNECHNNFKAPPYKKVYRRYLLQYSSKAGVEKAMIDFLNAPSSKKSAMPKGMKRRFNPDEHPIFDAQVIKRAVKIIIEREDIVKRLILSP